MPEPQSNAQPVAIVTGASSGIGRATAGALADAGYTVVGTSRDSSSVPALDGVAFLDLDVSRDESVRALVTEVFERFGRIDVLVNNAGMGLAGAAEESSISQAKAVFETNLFGTMRMTKAVLPYMRSQSGGRVINVSSILGLIPAPYMAIYAATKHAMEGYSESVDHEVRDHGIRVVLVEPGYTGTSFAANTAWSDSALPSYAGQRIIAGEVLAAAMNGADDPAIVAKVIVGAAVGKNPRLRYPAGRLARRVGMLRRLVPSRAFDKQIRKVNRLPA